MQELAAAIAARVPAAEASAPASPLNTKGGRETTEAPASAPSAKQEKPAAETSDATLDQLRQLTQGLHFVSESEAPLEAVSYAAPAGQLTDAALRKLAGQPADTKVEKLELTYFLRNHTADDGVLGDLALANRFKALQMYLKQELNNVQVYRFGQSPQVPVLALGEAEGGQLAGFKTVLTET
nr:nuclease A inhibitor family protein [Hymenobacter guriensis]